MNLETQDVAEALKKPVSPPDEKYILHRRFDRIGRLLGDQKMETLFRSHVLIIGLGGVGSWAAESLARSGVGRLTLVDFDDICITNSNRQLHTLTGLIGQKKAPVMVERLRKINPAAKVESIDVFYNEENSRIILEYNPDFVLDAIDNITAKCHLLAACRKLKIPVITSGGSGSRMDPLQVKLADLSETYNDPLCQQVRKTLRTKYDFPDEGTPFGIPCIFSSEMPSEPVELKYDKGMGFRCVCPQGANQFHSCEKRNRIWGTASFVTGSFGLVAAAEITKHLLSPHNA